MNFSIPFGSSQDAINAVVQRGVDAMFDIQATGGVADVAFVFEEEEGEEGEEEGRALEMNEEPPRPSRDEKKKTTMTMTMTTPEARKTMTVQS